MLNFGGKSHKTSLASRLFCLCLSLNCIFGATSCASKRVETPVESTHVCNFDRQVISEEYEKQRSRSCRLENLYYLSCACGKRGNETFSVGRGNHKFSVEDASIQYLCTEATEESCATYYYSCQYCGARGDKTFTYGRPVQEFVNRRIVIFGDSYSAYKGYVPSGYEHGYPSTDVDSVWEMWWSRLVQKTNSVIVRNDSWNGTTIGNTGYNGSDCSAKTSFISRYHRLKREGFFESNGVDTVLVFGGTNDSWANAPLGRPIYSRWATSDLYDVIPAICYFAYTLKTDLPDARIVFIINDGIKDEIRNGMVNACKHYGIEYVLLSGVDKINNHPTVVGMESICDQIIDALK